MNHYNIEIIEIIVITIMQYVQLLSHVLIQALFECCNLVT